LISAIIKSHLFLHWHYLSSYPLIWTTIALDFSKVWADARNSNLYTSKTTVCTTTNKILISHRNRIRRWWRTNQRKYYRTRSLRESSTSRSNKTETHSSFFTTPKWKQTMNEHIHFLKNYTQCPQILVWWWVQLTSNFLLDVTYRYIL
jgi:hypothetical protein